ncbi:MAG: c-type cytochrome [Gemmataceae bacterium]
MLGRTVLGTVLLVVFPCLAAAPPVDSPAERGRRAMLFRAYNPPTMTLANYHSAWKHWGLDQKPAPDEYDRLFRQRYGLHPAPFANSGLPMGLKKVAGPLPGINALTTDCLVCHGGSIFGQSYVGLGNSTLDFQAFYEEVATISGRRARPPFTFTQVRGTVEAGAMGVYLLGFREPDLTLRFARRDLDLQYDLCEDTPAWWLLKKKKTMYYTGGADTRSHRALMQFMMSPLNGPSAFHRAEADFKEIRQFLLALEAPKYPLAINRKLASEGETLFSAHCARCHGTYGEQWTYPNKVVPLEQIGTDPRRFHGITRKFGEAYRDSWFGKDHPPIQTDGYQAPPLDGIWATAPYLHNGSVPTLYHVLNSKARPRIFTRSFSTDRDAFDELHVGWKVQALQRTPDGGGPSSVELRKVYDTTKPGRSNAGHTYGDDLTDAERLALIEYLKTL